jgi:hypothetical protein
VSLYVKRDSPVTFLFLWHDVSGVKSNTTLCYACLYCCHCFSAPRSKQGQRHDFQRAASVPLSEDKGVKPASTTTGDPSAALLGSL